MEIKILETEKEVDQYAASIIIEKINKNPESNIGFATGNTPLGLYNHLIEQYQKGLVDFSKIKAFNLDEYVGKEKTDPLSFAYAMKSNLFSKINIKEENIYSLNGKAKDLNKECLDYEKLISSNPIDIQILGLGMDGHIAYNEPGTSFDSICHIVDLHEESINSSLDYGFTKIEDVPKQGMSQGISTIMKAKMLLMIVKGKHKQKLVKQMIEGKITEDFPGSIIQKHQNVIVLLDKEAAGMLEEE